MPIVAGSLGLSVAVVVAELDVVEETELELDDELEVELDEEK